MSPSHPTRPRRTIGISLKLYFNPAKTLTYYQSLAPLVTLAESHNIHLFLIPSIVTLPLLLHVNNSSDSVLPQTNLQSTGISLGAQDCSPYDTGAYTGEISPAELAGLGCELVEIGHAERRRLFGENDESVARKAEAVLRNNMIPLVCIGEKTKGSIQDAVKEVEPQVTSILDVLSSAGKGEVIFAYEPVWAIGQPAPASAEYVVAVVKGLREICSQRGREDVRVLYGGSAGPGTFEGIKEGVDGLFLGRFGHDIASVKGVIEEVARG